MESDLWVDDFIAGLVEEREEDFVDRSLLVIPSGWAHHSGHTGRGIHDLPLQARAGGRHRWAHVQLTGTL